MSGFPAAAFGWGALIAACVVVAAMVATFAIARALGRHRVIDITWGLGFVAIAAAVTGWAASGGHGDAARQALVLAAITAWGVRLAVHIASRGWGSGEDPRYEELLGNATGPRRTATALRRVYLPQAVVMWFVSLPIQVAVLEPVSLGGLAWAGLAVWVAGAVFEWGGDWQLSRFKARGGEGVLQSGLWRYTRHPNYFGDACQWWGLYLMACGTWQGAATIASPLLMTWLLARGTGKPTLEKRLRTTRPGYADYVRRTSGFVPLARRSG